MKYWRATVSGTPRVMINSIKYELRFINSRTMIFYRRHYQHYFAAERFIILDSIAIAGAHSPRLHNASRENNTAAFATGRVAISFAASFLGAAHKSLITIASPLVDFLEASRYFQRRRRRIGYVMRAISRLFDVSYQAAYATGGGLSMGGRGRLVDYARQAKHRRFFISS